MIGDLNIDFNKWEVLENLQLKLAELIQEEIIPLGVNQCVKGITRNWSGTQASLLDHMWTNTVDKVGDARIDARATSDHKLVWIDYWGVKKGYNLQNIRKQNIKTFNGDNLREKLGDFNWGQVFSAVNVHTAVFFLLTEGIKEILDTMIPTKTTQGRLHYADWLTQETLDVMKKRDEVRERVDRNGVEESRQEYRKLRNLCVKLNREDKKNREGERV